MMPKPHSLVLLGAGGHAKVVSALAEACGYELVGVCDPALAQQKVTWWEDMPVLGGDDAVSAMDHTMVGLLNGVGCKPGDPLRKRLYERMKAVGFQFPSLVHPTAWMHPKTSLGAGVQVMAGAIIQPGCVIGENTIINTGASVDHDCRIGSHVHIAPGAVLCGQVSLADSAYVGAGAVLIPGVDIGVRTIVGAGLTVRRNIDSDQVYKAKDQS